MELGQIRQHLDRIDDMLVTIIAERMSFVSYVSEYKLKNNIEQHHPQREMEILQAKKEIAKKYNVNEQFIEDLFVLIFAHSHKLQRIKREEKKALECKQKLLKT